MEGKEMEGKEGDEEGRMMREGEKERGREGFGGANGQARVK